MATLRLALRADLRRRWRALLSLALLLGLIGGVVLTAAAGAWRTDTAYPRLLSWANASQVDLLPAATGYPADYYAALAKLPQVAQLSTAVLYQVVLPTARHAENNQVTAMSSPDHAAGVATDKVKVLQGRPFDPAAPGQAMIDSQLAALEHVGPGGTLRLLGVPNDPKTGTPDFARRVPMSFRVTAVVVFDTQVVPIGGGSGSGNIEPTALVSSFPVPGAARTMSYGNEAEIRLRPGATVDSLSRAATVLAKRYPDTSGQILIISQATQVAATQQAIRPQAIALAAFAALAGLIALAVIGQLLSRQLALDSAEFPVLRAIGATRASLVALSLARLAVVTLAGGVIAVAVAIAASPLMPVGPARLAEPHPGVEVNLVILAAGFGGRRPARRRGARPARTPFADRRHAHQGRLRDRRRRRRHGVRAGPWPHRGPGAQRPDGQRHRGRRADRRRRLRHQPRRPGLHPARLRAELGRPARPGVRRGARRVRREGDRGRARRDRVRVRQLRPARDRRPDRARDRPGPAVRRRLPDDAGRAGARGP